MVLYDGVKVDLGITENCTIKNDDNGYMTIHGGYYSAKNACALQNANVAEINGGTFIQKLNDKAIITNMPLNDSTNKGKLSINGQKLVIQWIFCKCKKCFWRHFFD